MNQGIYPFIPNMQMMPGNPNFPNYYGEKGNNYDYDLVNRVERLVREIKKLESRVYRLEKNSNDDYHIMSKEYIKEEDDDSLYMV